MESLNITTLTSLDISLPDYSDGDIFVLGNSQALEDICQSINESIVNGVDGSKSFYSYSLRVLDQEDASYNIICPINNPVTGLVEYIVANIPLPLICVFIAEVISEAETTLQSYYTEAILFEATSNPALFKEAIQSVIIKPNPWFGKIASYPLCELNSLDGSSTQDLFDSFTPSPTRPCHSLGNAESEAHPKQPSKTAIEAEFCHKHHEEANVSSKDYLRELSAKERQRIFSDIPDKASDRALIGHPEAEKMLYSTLANMTPEEALALLEYLFKRHKAIGRTAVGLVIDGSSQYVLHISERGMQTTKEYRNKAQYNMFLKGPKGETVPIVFKHTASYCIYMMHVIDRYVKKGNAKAIDLHQCKREFCETYATLLDETPESILSKYETLFTRNIVKDGVNKERNGRYKDYIKDIHHTFEMALGFKDSMPFKIGENRFLPLIPDNIVLPKKLIQLKIS